MNNTGNGKILGNCIFSSYSEIESRKLRITERHVITDSIKLTYSGIKHITKLTKVIVLVFPYYSSIIVKHISLLHLSTILCSISIYL